MTNRSCWLCDVLHCPTGNLFSPAGAFLASGFVVPLSRPRVRGVCRFFSASAACPFWAREVPGWGRPPPRVCVWGRPRYIKVIYPMSVLLCASRGLPLIFWSVVYESYLSYERNIYFLNPGKPASYIKDIYPVRRFLSRASASPYIKVMYPIKVVHKPTQADARRRTERHFWAIFGFVYPRRGRAKLPYIKVVYPIKSLHITYKEPLTPVDKPQKHSMKRY